MGIAVGVAGCSGIGVPVGATSRVASTLFCTLASRVASAALSSESLASTVASISGPTLPPQPTSSTTAVERRSSRMNLIFTQPYYPRRLQNGSAVAISWLQYVSDPLLYRRTSRHW